MSDEILMHLKTAAGMGHAGAMFVLGCGLLLGHVDARALDEMGGEEDGARAEGVGAWPIAHLACVVCWRLRYPSLVMNARPGRPSKRRR